MDAWSSRKSARPLVLPNAAIIGFQLGTLRNWEKGRREPTGPAKALLRAIYKDPKHVIRVLSA